MARFRKMEDPTLWRRMARAVWIPAGDPTIHGFLEVDASRILEFLDEVRRRHGVRVTLTHVIAKALALSIREYPLINGVIRRGSFYLRDTVDIFVLAARDPEAVERGGGLSGVKLERADERGLTDLARELDARLAQVRRHQDPVFDPVHDLASRLPDALLRPLLRLVDYLTFDLDLDLSRFGLWRDGFGSAIVTNVGMLGLTRGVAPFFPLAHCPLLISVGALEDRPVAVGRRVQVRPTLTMGCTVDHRFIDGLGAGRLSTRFREILADPHRHLAEDLRPAGPRRRPAPTRRTPGARAAGSRARVVPKAPRTRKRAPGAGT